MWPPRDTAGVQTDEPVSPSGGVGKWWMCRVVNPHHHVAVLGNGTCVNRLAQVATWPCWDTTGICTVVPRLPHSTAGTLHASKEESLGQYVVALVHDRHVNRHAQVTILQC